MDNTVLSLNGSVIDRVAQNVILLSCLCYQKDGMPSLRFAKTISKLTNIPPWDNATVDLEQDGVMIFSGDVGSRLIHFDQHLGWVCEYTALGLQKRAEYVPVTDSLTLTDTIRFNLAADDVDYLPSRAGRNLGEIVIDVLEMPQISAGLAALGIGNFTSSGSGAQATCTVTGTSVSAFHMVSGGSGYGTTPPTVVVMGGGGSGCTGTAVVSGGIVTGVTLVSGGSGYTSLPQVVLSKLPASTLTDVAALNIISPFPVIVSGERVLQSLEGCIQSVHPNHFIVAVVPGGDIRILDPRTFVSDINLTINDTSGDPRVGMPQFTVEFNNCYTRAIVRGNSLIQGVLLGLKPFPGSTASDGGIQELFAWGGFTNTQAKTNWTWQDFISLDQTPGNASGLAVLSGSTVGSVSVQYQGYSYTSAPTVTISGGGGTGATATATLTSGKVTSFTVTAAGSGYTSVPSVLITPPGGVGQTDSGTCTCPSTTSVLLTSSNPHATWGANEWDWTITGKHGALTLYSDVITGYQQVQAVRSIANASMSAGGSSLFTVDPPLPATTYNSYKLTGTAGGPSNVYRLYKITNPEIAERVANYFQPPQAYKSNGMSATLVSTPIATVFYSPSGVAPYAQSGIGVTLDPESGTLLTSKPTSLVFSADGKTKVEVQDLQVFVPVFQGSLETVYPPDVSGVPQYEGTAYTVLGIERTKIITVPDWRDSSNFANMNLMAKEFLDTVKDIVFEGNLPYYGCLNAALLIGHNLNLTGSGFLTGLEDINIPITAVELVFNERAGGTNYTTNISFSNRRAPFSGAAFQRPAVVGQPFGHETGLGLDVEGFGKQYGFTDMAGEYHAGEFQKSVLNTAEQAGVSGESLLNTITTPANIGIGEGGAAMVGASQAGGAAMLGAAGAGMSGMMDTAQGGVSGMLGAAGAGMSGMVGTAQAGMAGMVGAAGVGGGGMTAGSGGAAAEEEGEEEPEEEEEPAEEKPEEEEPEEEPET